MKMVLKTIGLATGLAVALGIDIAVLLGFLPVSVAAFIAVTIAIIAATVKFADHKSGDFVCINAVAVSSAARKGEDYVITGKSVHNNPGKFERSDR
jgi:hypothetical protein